jgi:hypothetical protein
MLDDPTPGAVKSRLWKRVHSAVAVVVQTLRISSYSRVCGGSVCVYVPRCATFNMQLRSQLLLLLLLLLLLFLLVLLLLLLCLSLLWFVVVCCGLLWLL